MRHRKQACLNSNLGPRIPDSAENGCGVAIGLSVSIFPLLEFSPG
jgi:hypothetical protein